MVTEKSVQSSFQKPGLGGDLSERYTSNVMSRVCRPHVLLYEWGFKIKIWLSGDMIARGKEYISLAS